MPVGATSWSFTEDDFGAINRLLQRFLYDSNARCALLVDRSGQLVTTVGEKPNVRRDGVRDADRGGLQRERSAGEAHW